MVALQSHSCNMLSEVRGFIFEEFCVSNRVKMKTKLITFNNNVRIVQYTHSVSVTIHNKLMLYMKIISVCSEDQKTI